MVSSRFSFLPNKGLSEVTGIVADTVFRNTVKESRTVTPVGINIEDCWPFIRDIF